jgi:hypothetical protein
LSLQRKHRIGARQTLTIGIVILEEDLDHVNVLRSRERITPDPDTERLSKTSVGRLCDRLIGQRPGTGDDTCGAKKIRHNHGKGCKRQI